MSLQHRADAAVLVVFMWLFDSGKISYCADDSVSIHQCLVWGPGLETDFVVPARYFFIQAVNDRGYNVTDSVGEKAFVVDIEHSEGRTFAWIQVLDRHDGSYIVRYRLMASYNNIVINILYNGQHVAKSPYRLQGSVYHEKCDCPESSFDKWLETMHCSPRYEQIDNDLSIFPHVDMHAVSSEAVRRFNQRGAHSLCHYVIKDNKVYRKTFGQHVGFKMFMDNVLLSLTRKVKMPDIELFSNLGDWPLESKRVNENPIPIFSWCGSDDRRDIIMPTYDLTESTLETMGRVSLDLLSVQSNTGPRWRNKSSMALWRGRDSRQERLDLVKLSRKHPDIIDAKLTNMFFFKHDDSLGEIVKHMSFFDFFNYKYEINIDGTVAAYRLPYLLAGDSVVLKQDSNYYEHFYHQLKPYEHYIPFKRDLSDLLQQIQWAKDHDNEAEKIGKNAQTFVRNNLMSGDIFCYHAVLFKEYSKRLTRPPKVLDDMELVEQPQDDKVPCQCHRRNHDEL